MESLAVAKPVSPSMLTALARRLQSRTARPSAAHAPAGMKGSKGIAAINKDRKAPIFSLAEVRLEADHFTAVPELVQAL
jgi:hypothetical protein